jgi:multiple sugar transport system substrate-binding protein
MIVQLSCFRSMRETLMGAIAGITTAAFLSHSAVAAGDPIKVASQSQRVVRVAYSADYYPNTPQMLASWIADVQQGAKKSLPDITIVPEPIQGGFDDFITKLSLMFGNAATAPDLAIVPSQEVGQWQSSGLLENLDPYLKSTDWWGKVIPVIKNEGLLSGHVYYVSMGDGDNGLLFDKTLFAKAGLPDAWKPKTWNEILDAARAIKKAEPDVWPLWLITGTAQGSEGVILGSGNLFVASSNPVAYDDKTHKWIVDSKGLREVIDFYRTAAKEELLAPSSEIMDQNAPGIVAPFLPKHKIGIALAGDYVPTLFSKQICNPCWSGADSEIGVVAIPTVSGQPPGVESTLGGWGLVMNANSKDKNGSWQVFNLMMSKPYLLGQDRVGSMVPPISAYSTEPFYLEVSPNSQALFASIASESTELPSSPDFKVWAFALAQATETVVLHPNTPDNAVISAMKSYVSNQIDDDSVEELK